MRLNPYDLRDATALVVDGNVLSRSVLVSQLRDLGFRSVLQSPRVSDARRQLEFKTFDLVVCEQHFATDVATGQELLDDLRRCGLLPFSTVFIMITAEATYATVAEAAESALDSYLLRPYTQARLEDRIIQARQRKLSLKAIFEAVEAKDFALGAKLCLERFAQRGDYWLYAARVGAELLLRLEQYEHAQKLYHAVIEAKTLPWARLGVARAQVEAGQVQKAVHTLEGLISDEPGYADAYDVMGRAHVESGDFTAALEAYRTATTMTPSSISRLQRHGMLAHYCGDTETAQELLQRSVRLGLDSKMFDAQTLVLLATMRFDGGDTKGLQRCSDDINDFVERFPDSERLQRLAVVVDTLQQLKNHQTARALELVRQLMGQVREDSFDFEAACNLLMLVSRLAAQAIQIDEVDQCVRNVGMRFCNSRALTDLLARAAGAFPAFTEIIAQAQQEVLHRVEEAMRLSLEGKPQAAVVQLTKLGEVTQNAKPLEAAWGVLKRYEERINNAEELAAQLKDLRARYAGFAGRATIGDKNARQAGGVSLRVMDVAAPKDVSGTKLAT